MNETASTSDRNALIGTECHIVSGREKGPRYRPLPSSEVDAVENLILLCRNCHQLVDEQVKEFTEERLREMKRTHEQWVSTVTNSSVSVRLRGSHSPAQSILCLIETGQQLMASWGGAHSSQIGDRPEPRDRAEAEMLSEFLATVTDWAESWNEIGLSGRLEAEFELSEQLRDLRETGFVVYAGEREFILEGGHGAPAPWRNAVISIYRIDDPAIRQPLDDDTSE